MADAHVVGKILEVTAGRDPRGDVPQITNIAIEHNDDGKPSNFYLYLDHDFYDSIMAASLTALAAYLNVDLTYDDTNFRVRSLKVKSVASR